jgi:hypothetical protein
MKSASGLLRCNSGRWSEASAPKALLLCPRRASVARQENVGESSGRRGNPGVVGLFRGAYRGFIVLRAVE